MSEDDEALRRRLYRPGAVAADVRAYLEVAEPKPAPHVAPSLPPHRSHRWRWSVAGVAVLLAVAGVLVPRLTPAGAEDRGPAPLPTRSVDPETGAGFVSALSRGDDAGLGTWWEPGAPYLEQHGTGNGTVELPVSASARGGRLTVLLVLAKDAVAGWSAARLVIHDDRTIHLQQQAEATGRVRAGVPAIGRFSYTGDHRPLRLFVHAPSGVRWGVAAVFDG